MQNFDIDVLKPCHVSNSVLLNLNLIPYFLAWHIQQNFLGKQPVIEVGVLAAAKN